MPINQPEDQPQGNSQLIKFIHQCQRKIFFAADVNAQNGIKTMLSIALNGPLVIKDLSTLTKDELDKKIEEIALLKKIKCKNQNGIKTSEGFELFNSINDHCSAIFKAIKDNRLEQKQKKNESTSEAIRSKFEAFRSKLKRGFGSPQEREIKGSYAITIQARLNGIKANLSMPTKEAQNLMNNVSADLLAEQLPHVPGNNIGHNSTQGGSGNNHQGPKSFTEMVDAIVKDAFDQAKKAKEAETKLPPTPPPAGPKGATPPPLGRNTQGGGYESDSGSGYTSDDFKTTETTTFKNTYSDDLPDDLFSNDPVDDLEAGASPSPSPRNRGPETKFSTTRLPTLFLRPEGGAARRVTSYQPPQSEESKSTLVVSTKKGAQTPPTKKTTVTADIKFFNKIDTKAPGNEGFIAARENLIEIQRNHQKELKALRQAHAARRRAHLERFPIKDLDGGGSGR